MTGQINLEHKKPTEEKPLFIQASMMSDTKADFNATSAWQLSPTVYTILLGHVSGNFKTYDMNDDGFRDDPKMLQFNVANRWLYYTPELQVRWGVKAVRDHRQGGMDGYDKAGWNLVGLQMSLSWNQQKGTLSQNISRNPLGAPTSRTVS